MVTRRAGMVLIDVIVATILLGVALVVMVGLAGRAISAQSDGEQLQIAAMLIDEQLNLVLMRGPDDYASRFETTGPCPDPFAGYTYQVDISGGEAGNPYTVEVTVRWTARGGSRSASISTFIAPRLGDDPDPERRPMETVERYH